MSGYSELFDYCQTLKLHIGRNEVLKKVQEITGRKVVHFRAGLDINRTRGFYLSPANGEHPLVQQNPGRDIVVTARDNNRCWERLVFIKELMHSFDTPIESTSSAQRFENLIKEFSSPRPDRSIEMDSEIKALWRAIGIFCPEHERVRLMAARVQNKMSDLDIAKELKMPEQTIPSLFHEHYKEFIEMVSK